MTDLQRVVSYWRPLDVAKVHKNYYIAKKIYGCFGIFSHNFATYFTLLLQGSCRQ